MKDTIYRADAIEAIQDAYENDAIYKAISEDIINALSALPSAEAVHGWVPCSEKLPSESGWYVISVVGLKNITDVSYFYSDESKWSDVSHTQTVTAWMPLPTPYKGGDDDD